MNTGIRILIDGASGIYIPKRFYNEFDSFDKSKYSELDNPDNELYWETWADLLDNYEWIDKDGYKWTLHQDGDLFLVCPDLMTNEEYQSFYGEIKPPPDNVTVYFVCQDCLIGLANDDYSGMDDNQELATRNGIGRLMAHWDNVVPDGQEVGFTTGECECCRNGLAGDKYTVYCYD